METGSKSLPRRKTTPQKTKMTQVNQLRRDVLKPGLRVKYQSIWQVEPATDCSKWLNERIKKLPREQALQGGSLVTRTTYRVDVEAGSTLTPCHEGDTNSYSGYTGYGFNPYQNNGGRGSRPFLGETYTKYSKRTENCKVSYETICNEPANIAYVWGEQIGKTNDQKCISGFRSEPARPYQKGTR